MVTTPDKKGADNLFLETTTQTNFGPDINQSTKSVETTTDSDYLRSKSTQKYPKHYYDIKGKPVIANSLSQTKGIFRKLSLL